MDWKPLLKIIRVYNRLAYFQISRNPKKKSQHLSINTSFTNSTFLQKSPMTQHGYHLRYPFAWEAGNKYSHFYRRLSLDERSSPVILSSDKNWQILTLHCELKGNLTLHISPFRWLQSIGIGQSLCCRRVTWPSINPSIKCDRHISDQTNESGSAVTALSLSLLLHFELFPEDGRDLALHKCPGNIAIR